MARTHLRAFFHSTHFNAQGQLDIEFKIEDIILPATAVHTNPIAAIKASTLYLHLINLGYTLSEVHMER